MQIDTQTSPERYRHWKLRADGAVATLIMDVDADGGIFGDYQLKLNSYDLGVDIELADAVMRLRFEHPEVKAVVLRSAKERVFCAGANIRMLAGADHGHKVNFCKFTNETRNMMEAGGRESGQHFLCAIEGSCAGGGYELALACDWILLIDDGSSNVALPEAPLLAVLPGTGGLTRLTDKRRLRRDRADVFCTMEEGARGRKAMDWKLVDEVVPKSRFEEAVAERATAFADGSERTGEAGVSLIPLSKSQSADKIDYSAVEVSINRSDRTASIAVSGPAEPAQATPGDLETAGATAWILRVARELDDAILHLRLNEPEIGVITFHTQGDPAAVIAHERVLLENANHWLCNEIICLWKRVLKRIDLTSRSLAALIEPGSCFAGLLAEITFACDRSYMADGEFEGDNRQPASLTLTPANFGPVTMSNGLTRLETRFLNDPASTDAAHERAGSPLDAEEAAELGLVTFAYDDIDWEDEVRIFLEERASFSPDAMTAMEANLRFAGPETMETRIFGRLTAWQNWVFQRPNAVGPDGALQRYGTGRRGDFDTRRT